MIQPKRRRGPLPRIGVALTAAVALGLGGCQALRQSTYGQYLNVVQQAWSAQFGTGAITREQAAKISYASMGYRVDGGHELLIVLATDSGGELLWTSSDRIVLVTRDGRLTRTAGLPQNLAGKTSGELPSPAAALHGSFVSVHQRDFPDIKRYGVNIKCQTMLRGRTTISILGSQMAVMRVDEACAAREIGWSFTDTFWVDPQSGMIWKANLHVHPGGETIQTEIFRPPS